MKKLWQKINGWKTVSGLVISGIGIVMFNNPFTAPAAPYVLSSGLAALGVGATHKIIKSKKE